MSLAQNTFAEAMANAITVGLAADITAGSTIPAAVEGHDSFAFYAPLQTSPNNQFAALRDGLADAAKHLNRALPRTLTIKYQTTSADQVLVTVVAS